MFITDSVNSCSPTSLGVAVHKEGEKTEREAVLWYFHCDQLLILEQSPNCGGHLVGKDCS